MTLELGATLGHYAILAPLGAGAWARSTGARPVRLSMDVSGTAVMPAYTASSGRLAISPDGTTVAYVGPGKEDLNGESAGGFSDR